MLSDSKFNLKMNKARQKNLEKERKLALKAERSKFKKDHKKISTIKLVLLVVIILCIQIIAFTEYIMIKFNDASALYVLIGVPATLVPTIWGYYAKAKQENSEGGITYELALREADSQIEDNGGTAKAGEVE